SRRASARSTGFRGGGATISSLHRTIGGFKLFSRSHQGELNSRPAAYKAAALPTELWWRVEPMGRCGKSVLRGPRPNSRKRISFLGIMEKALFEPPNLRGIA